ncbi:hypothetical protein L7F22_032077 [Adiantum nelumboides]|nr:hypothetical protein [Adiantum nelumboides]
MMALLPELLPSHPAIPSLVLLLLPTQTHPARPLAVEAGSAPSMSGGQFSKAWPAASVGAAYLPHHSFQGPTQTRALGSANAFIPTNQAHTTAQFTQAGYPAGVAHRLGDSLRSQAFCAKHFPPNLALCG